LIKKLFKAIAVGMALLASGMSWAETADYVFTNGKVYTVNGDQGERVHGYGGSGWSLVDHEHTQREPDWGHQSSPLGTAGRRHRQAASSLGNPLITQTDVKCSQDGRRRSCSAINGASFASHSRTAS
jgi:hypothetical protein